MSQTSDQQRVELRLTIARLRRRIDGQIRDLSRPVRAVTTWSLPGVGIRLGRFVLSGLLTWFAGHRPELRQWRRWAWRWAKTALRRQSAAPAPAQDS